MPKITTAGGPSHPDDKAARSALSGPGLPGGPAREPGPEPAAAPPPVSALKAEHVEYAVEALGVPPEAAESMTKPELVELARTAEPEAAPDGPRPAPTLSRPSGGE